MHKIKVITIKHNYSLTRLRIYILLTQKSFQRKYLGFSKWDDWYVKLRKLAKIYLF